MNNKKPIGYYREQARKALSDQWGSMAWITFVAFIVVVFIEDILNKLFQFSAESTGRMVLSFVLTNFLFFAITYATYYCALQVKRGQSVEVGMLSIVFQKKLYKSMFLLNIVEYVIGFIINLIFLLPVFFIAGSATYFTLVFSNNLLPGSGVETTNIFVLSFLAIFILVVAIITFFITVFIGGVFQFAVWSNFDQPNRSLKELLNESLGLMKGRFGQYILLQLSFLGWYILAIFTLGIGLCWAVPYKNVAIASFYENAREEVNLDETKGI